MGKTFSGDAGVGVSGTMVDNGAVTLIPSTSDKAVVAGYHNGSGVVAGDTNLVTTNIKSGTNIFGVVGDTNVVDTSSGDAESRDMLSGKIAYVDGAQITGSMATQNLSTDSVAVPAGYYAATTLSSVDTDLASVNVKEGVFLFGIEGNLPEICTIDPVMVARTHCFSSCTTTAHPSECEAGCLYMMDELRNINCITF